MRHSLILLILFFLSLSSLPPATMAQESDITVTIVYDNIWHDDRLEIDWGFAALIEMGDRCAATPNPIEQPSELPDSCSVAPIDIIKTGGFLSASGLPAITPLLLLFEKICGAVNYAHQRGIIHRDLKPSNIRVDAAGEPHVLDFGLSKVELREPAARSRPTVTLAGQFMGSLPWASPEQTEGQPGQVDIRTDVYALGVLLYQLLTGRFPYEVAGPFSEVIDRIKHIPPTRPSSVRREVDDELETIVLKTLAKELKSHPDPVTRQGELADAYNASFANPRIAELRGFLDAVIDPAETRHAIYRALRAVLGKREELPSKRNSNIPL